MARGIEAKNAYTVHMGGTRGNSPGHVRPRTPRPRGNIEQLSSGSLRVRVYAGKDILTGNDLYLKRTIPAGPTALHAAEDVREELVSQVEAGRHPRTNATVSQLVAEHLKNAELEVRVKQTLEGYARKHIDAQPIGGRALSDGDAQDVQALETFYAELRRCRDHCDGRSTVRHHTLDEHTCTTRCRRHVCKPLGKWTVRKIHFLISAAYESAIRWEDLHQPGQAREGDRPTAGRARSAHSGTSGRAYQRVLALGRSGPVRVAGDDHRRASRRTVRPALGTPEGDSLRTR